MVENVAPLQLDEEPFSSDGEAELAAEDMVGLDDWSAMLNNARLDDVLEVESFSGILDEVLACVLCLPAPKPPKDDN